MLAIEFRCPGRELTYGAGIHDELSEMAKGILERTGNTIEHWEKKENDTYILYFLTNALTELLLLKGDSGMATLHQALRIQTYEAMYGIRQVKVYEVDLL